MEDVQLWTPDQIAEVAGIIRDYLHETDPDLERQVFGDTLSEIAIRVWPVIAGHVRTLANAAICFELSCLGCARRLTDEAEIRADERRRVACERAGQPEDGSNELAAKLTSQACAQAGEAAKDQAGAEMELR